jgi:hypothetical protein
MRDNSIEELLLLKKAVREYLSLKGERCRVKGCSNWASYDLPSNWQKDSCEKHRSDDHQRSWVADVAEWFNRYG